MLSIEELDAIRYEDVRNVTTQEYFNGDEYAASMVEAKYCMKFDSDGNAILDGSDEYVSIETPADVFQRVASGLAEMEQSAVARSLYTRRWFSLMWLGWFRPGGSVLSGVGSPIRKSLLNCCTLPLSSDTIEGINRIDYDIMKCAAFRQGIGFDASALRPRGARVNNAAEESTGVVPWVEKLVDNGKWVGQKGRKPALLVSIKDHHPDIFEFINSKLEAGKLENANISVQLSNAFMEAVKTDADWELHFDFKEDSKYERISKTIKAKELFDVIVSSAFKSAEPGVQYIDLLRDGSMIHQVYKATGDKRFQIISTNACSEKSLPPYGVCNLLSLNNEMFSTNRDEYKAELEFIVPYIVRLSDNVTEYEKRYNLSPLPEQEWILTESREIGLGITNIHGWLLKGDIAYDSDEAIEIMEDFFKFYACSAFKASMALGKEKGNAPAFDRLEDKSVLMGSTYFNHIVNELFDGDASRVPYMRNMAHMSVAPTGSLSSTFPTQCFSSGIEPCIGPYYWRRTRAINKGTYTYYFMIPAKVKDYVLTRLDKESKEYKLLNDFSGSALDNDGKIGIQLAEIIKNSVPEGFFKPAHEIDNAKKIKLMGGVYDWVDAAISCTYNLPSTATTADVENIYMDAYDNGVRAVSVYVDGSREGILIFEDPKTNEKNNSKGQLSESSPRPIEIIPNYAPKRPESLECDIIYTSINGELWTVLVGLLNGKPYELFAGSGQDLYLPKSCKTGVITKQKSGVYSLEIMIRNSPVVYKDLATMLMTNAEKALTRILSLNLRHGVLPKYIVEQLKKADGNITAFSTAVSRVLSKYVDSYVMTGKSNVCPVCGESSLMFTEGCIKCVNPECSYSRCG